MELHDFLHRSVNSDRDIGLQVLQARAAVVIADKGGPQRQVEQCGLYLWSILWSIAGVSGGEGLAVCQQRDNQCCDPCAATCAPAVNKR